MFIININLKIEFLCWRIGDFFYLKPKTDEMNFILWYYNLIMWQNIMHCYLIYDFELVSFGTLDHDASSSTSSCLDSPCWNMGFCLASLSGLAKVAYPPLPKLSLDFQSKHSSFLLFSLLSALSTQEHPRYISWHSMNSKGQNVQESEILWNLSSVSLAFPFFILKKG